MGTPHRPILRTVAISGIAPEGAFLHFVGEDSVGNHCINGVLAFRRGDGRTDGCEMPPSLSFSYSVSSCRSLKGIKGKEE